MVYLHDEEEAHYDDATIQFEIQQFIDEWHYRILHSGLAQDWDRIQCLKLAVNMFRMHGMVISDEELEQYIVMEDESAMIKNMVDHIPMASRKTFEHFVLQLQLVVSTTTQVRHALEEGIPERVAECFEGGDSGPGQQILKQCIVEAGKQIHEAVEMHKSWKANTEARIVRLNACQEEAEHMRQQLEALQAQLSAFKGEQSNKSKAVLVGMADKNDKTLMHTIFSTWFGWLMEHKMNKEIHDKFKKEIQDAEDALINFKTKQLHISRGMLTRGAASGDKGLMSEVLRIWYKYVIEEGHSREMDKKLEEALQKFNAAQASAKESSKAVMGRMAAGDDHALVHLCFSSWVAAQEELLKEKEIDRLAKLAEERYKEWMAKKSAEARGVLDRMSGASETGLLHQVIAEWQNIVKEAKEGAEMERIMAENEAKFKSLKAGRSGTTKNVASRCHQMEEENMIMVFFYAWQTEAREQRVVRHYEGKLQNKNNQLEDVQNMFRSFASQLEQGIGNTPRTGKSRSSRSKGGGSDAGAPPALPQ